MSEVQILSVFTNYPYQFGENDTVECEGFGDSVFTVSDVLHKRTGEVQYVIMDQYGRLFVASENELSFNR